ncbi:MAG TPA: 1-acyl-sn-glycerol-3-phosphate acyltransferase [Anaerolineales bacterium]|nr:1-acyl-sn-glycerol-3-phosphate acyltransferase [Anaerolineales bacterium]
MKSALDTLTGINLDDLVSSFGWQRYPPLAAALRRLFIRPARKFASIMLDYDDSVGQSNLAEASRRIMRKYFVRDVRVHGRENLPQNGAALFLSNHPGMADTLSLFAAIDRPDLRIIAIQRPFLESLQNTTRQLFFIDDDPAKRMNAVRQVSAHLKNGGAALTFPAGQIEPDPEVYEGALESLTQWTDSAGVFLRFARDAIIIPTLVSGVVWERTTRHPLTRIKRERFDREKLAAALQLLAMVVREVRPTTVHVHFGRPITLTEVGSTDAAAIHQVVLQRMQELLHNLSDGDGVSAMYD